MRVDKKIMKKDDFDVIFTNKLNDSINHIFYNNYCEIIFYLGNSIININIENISYTLERGNILILPPGVMYKYLNFEKNCDRYIIQLSMNCITKLSSIFDGFSYCINTASLEDMYVLKTKPSTWKPFVLGFEHLLDEYNSKRFHSDLSAFSQVLFIISHINSTMYYLLEKRTAQKTIYSSLIEQIYKYIRINYDKNICLDDLAKYLNVSKSTITHTIKKQSNTTFVELLTQRRLTVFKTKVIEGKSIKQAYMECGFNDYSTFYRAFRKVFKTNPREFFTTVV